MSTTPVLPGPTPPTGALLWDLDNVVVARVDLPLFAKTLSGFVSPGSPRIAAAHWRTFKECRTELRALGFRVLSGGSSPDGADLLLLREARRLKRKTGVARFVVASNDRRFAKIANFADLDVLTLSDAHVSLRLRAVAETVTVLPLEMAKGSTEAAR